jgi:uncharacterized protein YbjT (DUF2867 family)
MKVIITGATGMVGEGVLLECLQHPDVVQVLIVNRKHYDASHPKLKELLVPDFFNLAAYSEQLAGYDGCFFCAGVSSVGMNEADYTKVTHDLTLAFATELAKLNPGMVFTYVSGSHTDSTGQGKTMWARVKGKTENDLMKLPFKGVYNFRPGIMKPSEGQKSIKGLYKVIAFIFPLVKLLAPGIVLTLHTVGRAMINCVRKGYSKAILEIEDISIAGKE